MGRGSGRPVRRVVDFQEVKLAATGSVRACHTDVRILGASDVQLLEKFAFTVHGLFGACFDQLISLEELFPPRTSSGSILRLPCSRIPEQASGRYADKVLQSLWEIIFSLRCEWKSKQQKDFLFDELSTEEVLDQGAEGRTTHMSKGY